MAKTLVYYFAFPHYRAEILEELYRRGDGIIEIAGGTDSRDSIKPLTRADAGFLTELESLNLGPFNWQKNIASRAISSEFGIVILGPATLSLSVWAVLLGRRLMRRKTYLWGQCGKLGQPTIKRFVQKIMNKAAHGLLVYGESEAAAAIRLGASANKVHIVNNATRHNERYIDSNLDEELYNRMRLRTREAINGQRLVLTYVGRLTDSKRLPVLFEAARRLNSRYKELLVRVVGGGSEEELLKREYSEPFIEFLGPIHDEAKLNEVLKESTLVVSPYDMGLVAIDALRVGVPVLIPDSMRNGPEVEALTEGINSMRFSAGKTDAVISAVDRWLQIAPRVSVREYTEARNSALCTWSPGSVAKKIVDSIAPSQ